MTNKKQLKKLVQKSASVSFKNGNLNEKKVTEFIKQFKKLPLEESMFSLKEYLKLIQSTLSKTTLTVESVFGLSQDEKNKLKKMFNLKFKILNFKFIENPSLLGGIKVRIGDVLIDSSIDGKIKQFKGEING